MPDGEEKAAPMRRRMLRIALLVFGAMFSLMIILFGVAWALTPVPQTAQKQATAQGSVIYYRDGKTVLARQGTSRKIVELDRVPEHVRDAVIAAENRSFYEDQGVSVQSTMRAIWSTMTGRQLQGGSTITQQMVRNYYSGLSQERSISRKFKEIMVALKVDQSKSKDWVLEQYLNTIYFGRGADGIQAAADAYFRKDVKDLTVAEGAYLAAVIQQPSRFADPKGPVLAEVQARWRFVVDGMVQTGALTAEQAAELRFPQLKEPKAPLSLSGQRGYMLEQVAAELRRRGYTDEDINQGGLRVVTTFDKKLMDAARKTVNSIVPKGTSKKVRTGLAAIDPATGEVVAFYGGRNYTAQPYDNAFSAKVQAGSTFKAYALAAALENGYGLETRVNGNSPLRVASAAEPIPNSGGVSYGQVNLVTAMRSSVNTAFVDLAQQVGLGKVAKAAEAAGIPADQISPHKTAATLPLGVASVSAVQNASGYGTFAAGGMHHEAHVIRSITDAEGKKTTVSAPGTRAFSEQTAADASYAMTQVVTAGTGTAARLWDRPVAGKTGTSDKSGSVWFVGYTPQLSVAVNMFRDDNKTVSVPGYGAVYGGTLPAQIFRAFMAEAMEGKQVKEFPEPSNYGYGYGGYERPNQWTEGYDPNPTTRDRPRGGENDEATPDPQPSATAPRTEETRSPPDQPTGPGEGTPDDQPEGGPLVRETIPVAPGQ